MKAERARRGQAALEFLTTYGWAFLVILVMIGALAYFGVINPNKFLPDRCQLQTEFACKDYQILQDGTVQFYFMNNLGQNVDELSFNATVMNSGVTQECSLGKTSLGAGESTSASCTGLNGIPSPGEKVKIILKGQYKVFGGKYFRPIQGEIFATVQ